MKKYKVLITGGNSGVLGQNFLEYLISSYKISPADIICINKTDYDLTNIDDINKICSDFSIHNKITHIIHCAYTPDLIDQNLIDFNILKYWYSCQPRAKLITFGSDAAYPEDAEKENKIHCEEYYFSGEPLLKWYSTGLQKRMLATQLLELPVELQWLHLVPSSLFGKYWKLSDTHLIPSLIKQIDSLGIKQKLKISGTGQEKKEIIFIDDFVKNCTEIIFNSKIKNQILNVGSDSKYQPLHIIVETLCNIMNFNCDNVIYSKKSSDCANKYLNNDKIKKILGKKYADTDLKSSLKEAVIWFNRL